MQHLTICPRPPVPPGTRRTRADWFRPGPGTVSRIRTFNGWLYDPQTGVRSVYGDNFAAYTAQITPAVNLQPMRVWAEPAPLSTLGGPVTLTLVAEIANSGNISTGQPVTVRFYKGNPGQGGALIGETQLSALLDGCGAVTTVRFPWTDLWNLE